jgi:group I intron endonuclease
MGIIYKATNLVNGKSYIGMTRKLLSERKFEHEIGRGSLLLRRAIKKHGEAIQWEILETLEANNFKAIGELERYYIHKFNTFESGYNLTSGGDGCGSGKGHPCFGKKLGYEQKRKISFANAGKPGNCGKQNGMYGRKGKLAPRYGLIRSERERQKIASALKGRTKQNDPAREKAGNSISKKLRGRTKQDYQYIAETAKKLSKGLYIAPFGEFYSLNDVFQHEKNFLGKSTLIRFYKNPNKVIELNSRYKEFRLKTPKQLGFYLNRRNIK